MLSDGRVDVFRNIKTRVLGDIWRLFGVQIDGSRVIQLNWLKESLLHNSELILDSQVASPKGNANNINLDALLLSLDSKHGGVNKGSAGSVIGAGYESFNLGG